MSLIDEKLTNNIKFDYGEDYYYFEYSKVKERVLELMARSDMYHKELIKEILGDFKDKKKNEN